MIYKGTTVMKIKTKALEILATWFYSGRAPVAPGTFGSLATLPFVYALHYYWGLNALLIFIAAVSLIGIWASDRYAKLVNVSDPGFIVIDETAGQSIALVFAGTNLWFYALGFALFRLFDITKPWPVSWADKKLKGGLGIMLDDILAGMMAAAVMWGIKIYLP